MGRVKAWTRCVLVGLEVLGWKSGVSFSFVWHQGFYILESKKSGGNVRLLGRTGAKTWFVRKGRVAEEREGRGRIYFTQRHSRLFGVNHAP